MSLGLYYTSKFLWSEDKTALLIGETTHGHYQIEMACTACHTDAFGGTESLQTACLNCHQQELQLADDSHPKSKFTDPRNADRVAILDARYCVTCHSEHQQEATFAMGLTIPEDYCFHCHQETLTERPSHQDLGFDTCATSGCHNYHDNRALYEDFLVENADRPAHLPTLHTPTLSRSPFDSVGLTLEQHDSPTNFFTHTIGEQWQQSSHATAEVNCRDCHQPDNHQQDNTWIEKPGIDSCRDCHAYQVTGFTSGKHGMRLSLQLDQKLSAMSPAMAKQHQFNSESLHHTQTCNACHDPHGYDTKPAAVDACLNCHSDQHSQAFLSSPHGQLWQQTDDVNTTAVSCATCHLPRESTSINGKEEWHVQHNQNANLRPNEKMIRGVCLNCHGLGFAIDALADQDLIDNNFNGKPSHHIPSIDWAKDRIQ